MRDMLTQFDGAALIVAYNGRHFDMRVLHQYYDGDEARWEAHGRKLLDPHDAVSRAAGRRVTLDTVLKLNGMRGKLGAGADAPAMWHTGRHEQLRQYCARDVDALLEVVQRGWVRVPGGGGTTEASVAVHLERASNGAGDARGEHTPHKRPRRGGADGSDGEHTARTGEREGRMLGGRRRTLAQAVGPRPTAPAR